MASSRTVEKAPRRYLTGTRISALRSVVAKEEGRNPGGGFRRWRDASDGHPRADQERAWQPSICFPVPFSRMAERMPQWDIGRARILTPRRVPAAGEGRVDAAGPGSVSRPIQEADASGTEVAC